MQLTIDTNKSADIEKCLQSALDMIRNGSDDDMNQIDGSIPLRDSTSADIIGKLNITTKKQGA